MYNKTPNAIQRARNSAGFTQEALAERAGYSDDTIRAWESGARNCPIDALGILSDILQAPWLTSVYLRELPNNSIEAVVPAFAPGRPIAEAAADYISSVLDLVDDRFDRKLLRMIADGKIDKDEEHVFEQIMSASEKLIKAYYEMRFAEKEGK